MNRPSTALTGVRLNEASISAPAQLGRHRVRRDQAGTSLVELAVSMMLLVLLAVVILPVVQSFSSESRAVQSTDNTVDKLIEPSLVLARFVHEAVAPAPPGSTTAPWSTLTAASGPDELQFTANIGPYGQSSDAGPFVSYGPALVTVDIQPDPAGNPALVATLAPAVAGTCPRTSPSGAAVGGTACAWDTASPIELFSISDPTTGSPTSPIFDYIGPPGTAATTSPATTCTDTGGVIDCPLDQVQAVQFTFGSNQGAGLANGTQSEASILAPAYEEALG